MPALTVQLFGELAVRFGEQPLVGLDSAKVQELFGYLLIRRGRRHSREALATLLWADNTAAQSKKYLRQVLWQLQGALESQRRLDSVPLLVTDADWIQLNPKASLWLDVGIFEQAYTQVRTTPGPALDAERAALLESAVQLYRGDLLEGWYHNWCLLERERLQQMYLAMLDRLMGYCEVQHMYEAGLVYGGLALQFDRAQERTHRRLMRLHYFAGDRTAALRQFDRCVVALQQELAVQPSRLTRALYEQVRTDQLEADSPPPGEATPADAHSSLSEILPRLEHLGSMLNELQVDIIREVHSIQLTITGRH